jgi:hypothetical protein
VGKVFFEDRGALANWDNFGQRPLHQGVLRTVTTPRFKGQTAIEAQQTYVKSDGRGYQSETVKFSAQRVGEDRYFGQAIYLAKDWKFHPQNVALQQFSPEKPTAPWLLLFIEGDQLKVGGSGGHKGTVTSLRDLRGTWIRVVTRLKLALTGSSVEVWVNGKKLLTRSGTVLPRAANSIRWSSGIHATAWRKQPPAGPKVLSVFHAQSRIASTYELAEPANW